MRADEKAVDFEDQHLLGRRTAVVGGEDDVLEHLLESTAVVDAGSAERVTRTYEQVEKVMAGRGLDERAIALLSPEQQAAMRLLQTAVAGRDRNEHLVYAEDRRDLLEHALAALQPMLAQGFDGSGQFGELRDRHGQLVEEVAELREMLVQLADAQEEKQVGAVVTRVAASGNEDGDEDAGADGDDADGDEADGDDDAAVEEIATTPIDPEDG